MTGRDSNNKPTGPTDVANNDEEADVSSIIAEYEYHEKDYLDILIALNGNTCNPFCCFKAVDNGSKLKKIMPSNARQKIIKQDIDLIVPGMIDRKQYTANYVHSVLHTNKRKMCKRLQAESQNPGLVQATNEPLDITARNKGNRKWHPRVLPPKH